MPGGITEVLEKRSVHAANIDLFHELSVILNKSFWNLWNACNYISVCHWNIWKKKTRSSMLRENVKIVLFSKLLTTTVGAWRHVGRPAVADGGCRHIVSQSAITVIGDLVTRVGTLNSQTCSFGGSSILHISVTTSTSIFRERSHKHFRKEQNSQC